MNRGGDAVTKKIGSCADAETVVACDSWRGGR